MKKRISNGKKIKSKVNIKKFDGKAYLKDFYTFSTTHLLKTTGILVIIAIIFIAITINPIVNLVSLDECKGPCTDETAFFSEYFSKIQELFIVAFSGIVPYMYIPFISIPTGALGEIYSIAYIIKDYGTLIGIAIGIIPLLLNVITLSITVALGAYICKTVTIGYRLSNLKNMNFLDFKIELYKLFGKKDKIKVLENKKQEKLNKLKSKKQKIKYLQILNTAVVICILQFISVFIQDIML